MVGYYNFIMLDRMIIGKGKHSEWHSTQYKGVYYDDYEPSNKK